LAQADELSAPHSHLQGLAAELSRLAGPARGVRHRLPLRAIRRAGWHDPRPRIYTRRRAPVHNARSGGKRVAKQSRSRADDLEDPRAERLSGAGQRAWAERGKVRRRAGVMGKGGGYACRGVEAIRLELLD